MAGIPIKKIVLGVIALVVIVRFRNQIAELVAKVPLLNKAAGVG